jgi:hypothetical protein
MFNLTPSERLVYAAAFARWVGQEKITGSVLGFQLQPQIVGGVHSAYNAVLAMRADPDATSIERDDAAAIGMFNEFKNTAAPDPSLDWKVLALELLRFAENGPARHDARVVEIGQIIFGDWQARQKRDSENLVRMLDMRAASIMGPGLGRKLIDELRAALGLKS